jgi:hypothetical protein
MNRSYNNQNLNQSVNHLIHRTIHNLQNVSMNVEQMNENDQRTLIQQLNAVNQMIETRRPHHHHRFPLIPPLTSGTPSGSGASYRDMHAARSAHSANHSLSHDLPLFSFNVPSESNRIRHEQYESPDGMHISISEFVADDMQGFNDGFNRIMDQALSSFSTIFSDRFNISIGGSDDVLDLSAPPPQRGLSDNYKSFLPVAPYSEMKLEEEEHSVTCTICQVKFEEETQVRCLPCSHLFHVECIDHWLTRGTTCPNCRDDIESSLTKLSPSGTTATSASASASASVGSSNISKKK